MPDRPVRTCVGCRARRGQDRLVRLHLDAEARVRLDRTGPGRGAWLCADDVAACLAVAIDRRALARAFRSQPDATSAATLLAALRSSAATSAP